MTKQSTDDRVVWLLVFLIGLVVALSPASDARAGEDDHGPGHHNSATTVTNKKVIIDGGTAIAVAATLFCGVKRFGKWAGWFDENCVDQFWTSKPQKEDPHPEKITPDNINSLRLYQ